MTKHNARSCESKYKILSKFVEIQNLSKYKIPSKFVEIQSLSKYKICRNTKFVKNQNFGGNSKFQSDTVKLKRY